MKHKTGRPLRHLARPRQRVVQPAAPQILLHPRAEARHVLIRAAPAVVAALDEMQQARLVLAGRVVVHGEQIAERIKRQPLRIPQADAKHLELRAIRLAAKHRACVRQHAPQICRGKTQPANILRRRKPAVAHAEVQFPLRPEHQPVQIMPRHADVNAETGKQIPNGEW